MGQEPSGTTGASLDREMLERPWRQEDLRAAIESISGELELRPLLARIVRHACELLHAERGTLGLVCESRKMVRTEAVQGLPSDTLGTEMPADTGLAGEALLTGRPVVVDIRDPECSVPGAMVGDAVLVMPLLWREKNTGCLCLGAPQPCRFDGRDMERLSLFAQHAAIAIENARRYEQARQRAERLALMARIGTIITSALDLDDLLQRTADAIHELLGYPYISIALRQPPHGSELVLAGVAGIKETAATKHHRLRLGEGIVGTVAETGQAILSQDLASDPRYVPTPGTRDIRSELAVPIRLGENVLGVLNAESAGVLTAEDETSLGIIADQLAVAIENARLYVSMRTTLDETWLMYQTSHRISTAMDVDGVIQAYLEQMPQGSPCVCSVALYEVNEAGERTAVVVRGRWSPEEGLALCEERYPYSNDALDPLLDAGQTVTIRNVHADIRASAPLREAQSESRRPAVAMIPLLVRGDRIGLVVLSYPRVYDWPEEVLRPYQTTAAQLATAIDSRRQHLLVVERGHQIAALEERQRLARDLHDSVTQLLFSITLMAQSLAGAWRRDPAEGEHRVGRLLDLSRSALAEMRALLTEWRPATSPADGAPAPRPGILQLRGEDLPTALRRHIAHITSSGLDVRLDTEGYAPQPPILEEALFRITQEALNNVQKHAGASRAEVGLSVEGGEVVLQVRDNGRGFDSNAGRTASDKSQSVQSAQSGGMGLAGMRERAEALGGRVHMQTEVGAGTLVEARLPITEVAPPPAREVEAK